jgi:hypothetical protein
VGSLGPVRSPLWPGDWRLVATRKRSTRQHASDASRHEATVLVRGETIRDQEPESPPAAPPSAPKGEWQEYRIYETNGGKHVFSKVTRRVFAEEQDFHEAEVFDPSPSSVPSQLLRSARDLARSRPMTWMDAAAAFFGYDPLAKALYRKLSGQFEEHIS